jgi:hypothetical protein
VGLEGAGWAEGEHRVALFDGQVEAAEEAVAEAVAAAEDDPPSPGSQDQQPAQLPPARPPRSPLPSPAAGAWGQQPHEQPVQEGWKPEGEHGGGVHADRAGEQRLGGGWPGSGRVVPGAGQAEQDPEQVGQPDRQMLMRPEDDGGDLTDQPHRSTGGEQQRRHNQPERIRDVLVVALGGSRRRRPGRAWGVGGHVSGFVSGTYRVLLERSGISWHERRAFVLVRWHLAG